MKNKKAITWRELKEFANSLDEEQLDYEVDAIGEERGFSVQSSETLGEDNYIDDYAMQPISVYDPSDNDDLPIEDSGYEIVKANKPYLMFDLWENESN